MKLTIEINPEHPAGTAIYIHNGSTSILQHLAVTNDAEAITGIVTAAITPAIHATMNPEPTFFLFTGEYSKAVYKSYKSYKTEDETDMATKVVTHAPLTGPIVKITKVDPGIALLLGLHYPVIDGIDGLIA